MKLKALRDIKVKGRAKVAAGETFEMDGPAAKYLVADKHAEVVPPKAEEKTAEKASEPAPAPAKKK